MKLKKVNKLLYQCFYTILNKKVQEYYNGYYQFDIRSMQFDFVLDSCSIKYVLFKMEGEKVEKQLSGEFYWSPEESKEFNLGLFVASFDTAKADI